MCVLVCACVYVCVRMSLCVCVCMCVCQYKVSGKLRHFGCLQWKGFKEVLLEDNLMIGWFIDCFICHLLIRVFVVCVDILCLELSSLSLSPLVLASSSIIYPSLLSINWIIHYPSTNQSMHGKRGTSNQNVAPNKLLTRDDGTKSSCSRQTVGQENRHKL